MGRGLKAAGSRDVDDWHRGLEQQLPSAAQAHLQVVPLGYAVEMALEEPFDLAPREPRGRSDLIERERLLDVFLHQLRDPNEALVAHADLRAQRHVLSVAVVADAIDDELLGDQLRHACAKLRLDEMEHQIQRRDAPRAGKAIAVDREELIRKVDARKLLA